MLESSTRARSRFDRAATKIEYSLASVTGEPGRSFTIVQASKLRHVHKAWFGPGHRHDFAFTAVHGPEPRRQETLRLIRAEGNSQPQVIAHIV